MTIQRTRPQRCRQFVFTVLSNSPRLFADAHPHTLTIRHNLAATLRRCSATTTPTPLTTRHNLAIAYEAAGRFGEAAAPTT